ADVMVFTGLPNCDATNTVRQYASRISILKYASSTLLWLQVTTPWFAIKMVLCLSTRSATSLPISGVPGVRYGAIATDANTSNSGIMQVGGTIPATAKPVL